MGFNSLKGMNASAQHYCFLFEENLKLPCRLNMAGETYDLNEIGSQNLTWGGK